MLLTLCGRTVSLGPTCRTPVPLGTVTAMRKESGAALGRRAAPGHGAAFAHGAAPRRRAGHAA